MNKKFSKLQLDKKSIAKLNEEQLSAVKGGNSEQDDDCRDGGITCSAHTATVVQTNS